MKMTMGLMEVIEVDEVEDEDEEEKKGTNHLRHTSIYFGGREPRRVQKPVLGWKGIRDPPN